MLSITRRITARNIDSITMTLTVDGLGFKSHASLVRALGTSW